MISSIMIAAWVGNKLAEVRVTTAGKTDRRVRLMNEISNGMKVIKMYTWEKAFTQLVEQARKWVFLFDSSNFAWNLFRKH